MITLDRIQGAIRSLTIWFNGIIAAFVPMYEMFKEELPGLQQYMTPELYFKLAMYVAIANIILRFRTTMDLANK